MQNTIFRFLIIFLFTQFGMHAFAEDAPIVTGHDIHGGTECKILYNIPAEELTQVSDYSFTGFEPGGFSFPSISQGGVDCTNALIDEWIRRYEIKGPVFQRDPSFIEYNSETGIFKLKYSRIRS